VLTTTVNLNRKVGYLSSQKKLKFFRDIRDVKNILSFCQCQNVFREEAFADQKVEEH